MNRTFSAIKTNCGTNVQDTDATFLGFVGNWVNDRYIEIKRRLNLLNNISTDWSFSTVAGTSDYILPDDFNKDILVIDTTNNLGLKRIDDQGMLRNSYSYIDLVTPVDVVTPSYMQWYCIFDRPVNIQPTSASVVSFVSDSASDTACTIHVRGLDASGRNIYEEKSLNGTSSVSTSSTFSKILGLSKSNASLGTVTFTIGATTVAKLAPESVESRSKVIRFIATPTMTVNIRIDYIQKELPLNSAYDYPIIDCADVLEAGATADAWRYKRQFAKAQVFEQIFEKRLANLVWNEENQPNQVHYFKPARPNRLTLF
jgi:hypothetical protein